MNALKSINDIDWSLLLKREFTPSPEAWEDQVLYFVMVDRFSDGNEIGYIDADGNRIQSGTTPLLTDAQKNSILSDEKAAAAWRAAGDTYCGGTLAGAQSKLGYLKRLGVTTLWLSPVLKQTSYDLTTYHGYGTQNFLDIDPHFGTREQLRSLVDSAHKLGMYVVLDIVINHAGNVFTYDVPDQSEIIGPKFNQTGVYPVTGFNDENGHPTLPFTEIDLTRFPKAFPNGAIWPRELQSETTFSCKGAIDQYETPDQYLHGDFMKLKDLFLGEENESGFVPSSALQVVTKSYQYWLAYADIDGFRLDAVKHMESGAVRYFNDEIQSFARQLGKVNFYIIGEVAGGREHAAKIMLATGLNAILAVDDVPGSLEALIKGNTTLENYFTYFANETSINERSVWQHNNVITMFDDHDQIRNGYHKARFAAGDARWPELEFNVLATLVTTMGIPGIYYGSEQAFDGEGGDDNYIREAMFGGCFGPFRSVGHHCFNEANTIYQQLHRLLAVRKTTAALRHGSQHVLTFSPNTHSDKNLIAWLRKSADEVILCVMNNDLSSAHQLSLDHTQVFNRRYYTCLFSSDENKEKNVSDKPLVIPKKGFAVYQVT